MLLSESKLVKFFYIAALILLFIMLIYFGCGLINARLTNDGIKTQKYNIVSIDLQSETNAGFIFGSGYVETNQYFVVYKVLNDGGKKLVKFPANDTIIYTTLNDADQAYMEVDTDMYNDIIEIRLYVPKNAIMQSYDLNF